jgi:prepilin-type N-terminal cleavage/methylation domain-containing protein
MSSIQRTRSTHRNSSGFTLVELVIALLIAAILVAMAAPAYVDLRERTIVRGAADNLVSSVAQAKLEAARRNDYITVSVRGSGNTWCIGLQSGTTGCDCTSATCNVTQVNTIDLSGAKLLAAANFATTPTATDFSIDPHLGMLRNLAGGGSVTLRSPTDSWDYRVQFNLSATGQTQLCVPTGGKHVLSSYPSC